MSDLLAEDMDPSILDYGRPLMCQKFTQEGSLVTLGDKFVLTWAQLDRIEDGEYLVFKTQDGTEIRIGKDDSYLCTT